MKTLKRLSQFRPQARNANKGKQAGLTQLDKSLRRDGYSAPMVAAADGEIFAGSKRLERAADVFGADIEPIVVHSDGTRPVIHVRDDIATADDPRAVRLGVADNAIAHMDYDPDGELLALLAAEDAAIADMVKADELSMKAALEFTQGEPQDAEPQIDRAAELREKWQTERGQLWRIGEHRLLCGDSTKREDVERVMGGEKANLMVTDPPYGVDYDPEWRDGVDKKGLLGNLPTKALGKVENDDRIDWSDAYDLFGGEVVYCWHSGLYTSTIQENLERSGFEIVCQIIWDKPQGVFGRGNYHWQHEPCWYAVRKGKNHRWSGSRTETTVWKIAGMAPFGRSRDESDARTGHGTQKPVECMARPIRNHDSELVYEPFAGSGTTLVACQNLSRRCRAIEIDPKYCAVILQRMTDAFPGIEIERVTS